MQKILFLALILGLVGGTALGATYTVCPSGCDGTLANFEAGNAPFDNLISDTVEFSGAIPDIEIPSAAFGSQESERAVLDFSNATFGEESATFSLQNRAPYVDIINVTITNTPVQHNIRNESTAIYTRFIDGDIAYAGGGETATKFGIYNLADNVSIINTEISYSSVDGIFSQADHIIITGCHIHDINQYDEATGNGDCIHLDLSGVGYSITNNILDHRNSASKGAFICSDTGTTNGVFSGNTVYVDGCYGMSDTSDGSTFSNNKIIGLSQNAGTTAFMLGGSSQTFVNNLVDNAYTGVYARNNGTSADIFNNTIINTLRPIDSNTTNAVTLNVVNNILEVEDFIIVESGCTYTGSNNAIYPEASAYLRYHGTSYNTLAAWQSATSQDANSVAVDPLLNSDGSLTSSSPCINAGTEAATVGLSGDLTDGFGNSDTFAGAYNLNIGADQTRFNSRGIMAGKILSGKILAMSGPGFPYTIPLTLE